MKEELLTVAEVAKMLGVSRSRLYVLISEGRLKVERKRPYMLTREAVRNMRIYPTGRPPKGSKDSELSRGNEF